jgi:hypothetical protein
MFHRFYLCALFAAFFLPTQTFAACSTIPVSYLEKNYMCGTTCNGGGRADMVQAERGKIYLNPALGKLAFCSVAEIWASIDPPQSLCKGVDADAPNLGYVRAFNSPYKEDLCYCKITQRTQLKTGKYCVPNQTTETCVATCTPKEGTGRCDEFETCKCKDTDNICTGSAATAPTTSAPAACPAQTACPTCPAAQTQPVFAVSGDLIRKCSLDYVKTGKPCKLGIVP